MSELACAVLQEQKERWYGLDATNPHHPWAGCARYRIVTGVWAPGLSAKLSVVGNVVMLK